MEKYFVSIIKANKTKHTTEITGDFFNSKAEAKQNLLDIEDEFYTKYKLLGYPYTENYCHLDGEDMAISVDVLDVNTAEPELSEEITFTIIATQWVD